MKRYNSFSLLELLTVVVIASILLTIAVPAFSRIMRGSASTQAGRELMGRIRAARAYAVAQQTPVAIVFYRTEVPSGKTLSYNYACSAYRICTVKYMEPSNSSGNLGRWVFQDWVSEWYFLPAGISVGLPATMTNTLPAASNASVNAAMPESDDSLIRVVSNPAEADSTAENFFKVGTAGSGVSPVYSCDLTDIYEEDADPVTFRNAIVFNSNGMMEKPKNLALEDGKSSDSLQPDRAIVIPLRQALIDRSSVVFDTGTEKEYIPVRVDPSGKTYFFDGVVEF
ncbi:MAG: prepilin-type N-terminal cleavage/methylation domain-containing protein [Lentisphaeria bacterium]|nr:prepilin-type N-terminal cleavage/methylation domain-containing protein [Lentisphaeria bacterium]